MKLNRIWTFIQNGIHSAFLFVFSVDYRLMCMSEGALLLAPRRHATRFKNPGGHIVLGGDNVPPLVEIGLTDLPKSGGARAPPAPPLATGLGSQLLLVIWDFKVCHIELEHPV